MAEPKMQSLSRPEPCRHRPTRSTAARRVGRPIPSASSPSLREVRSPPPSALFWPVRTSVRLLRPLPLGLTPRARLPPQTLRKAPKSLPSKGPRIQPKARETRSAALNHLFPHDSVYHVYSFNILDSVQPTRRTRHCSPGSLDTPRQSQGGLISESAPKLIYHFVFQIWHRSTTNAHVYTRAHLSQNTQHCMYQGVGRAGLPGVGGFPPPYNSSASPGEADDGVRETAALLYRH